MPLKAALIALCAVLGILAGVMSADGLSKPPCGKKRSAPCPTTSTVATTTASTTTEVTTTEPGTTEEQPPPSTTSETPTNCTKELSPGGDLSAFLGSLSSSDVGCLHGGTYTDGTSVTLSQGTLTEYPGEHAEIAGTMVVLSGSVTLSELTIRDTAANMSCVDVSGPGAQIVHNELLNCARHGILLHTDSSNVLVTRNFNDGSGLNETSLACCNHVHGIYVQGSGHVITRNVFANMREGYGIHLYAHPSNVVVSQNVAVGSLTRNGILIDTDGGNNAVVNNIVWGNASSGINNRLCGSGCLVSNNLTTDPQFIDSRYHVAATSPAVDAARSDYDFSPDLDGNPLVNAPDIGAYER